MNREYHVGCGLAAIYAGTLSKAGEWKNKSPVTDEAISAVANFLIENKTTVKFRAHGKCYRMAIIEITTEASNE